MPQLFRVRAQNLIRPSARDTDDPFFHAGEVRTAEDFAGCDLGWLVKSKAIEPINGAAGTLLVGSDPSKAELRKEVDRLQGIIEDLQARHDSRESELSDLRELRDRVPLDTGIPKPPPDPSEAESLRAAVETLNATVANLTKERDDARDRADKYANELTLARAPTGVKTTPPVVTAAPPPSATPANQNPVPNPPTTIRKV